MPIFNIDGQRVVVPFSRVDYDMLDPITSRAALNVIRGWRIYSYKSSLLVIDTYNRVRFCTSDLANVSVPALPVSITRFVDMYRRSLIRDLSRNLAIDSYGMVEGRTFGIELECIYPTRLGDRAAVCERLRTMYDINIQYCGYSHTTTSYWKMVTDSSLSGDGYSCEIVSPVLEGASGVNEISKLCTALDALGFSVNRSCGFHVHHGASGLSYNDRVGIVGYYKANESIFDSLVSPSRRGDANTYCHSLREVPDNQVPHSRYYKVNLEAFSKHGTVEFRQHQGTINFRKIVNWIRLTQRVVVLGRFVSSRAESLDSMLEELRLNDYRDFFVERARELGA